MIVDCDDICFPHYLVLICGESIVSTVQAV